MLSRAKRVLVLIVLMLSLVSSVAPVGGPAKYAADPIGVTNITWE